MLNESDYEKICLKLSSETLDLVKLLKKGQKRAFFEILDWALFKPFGASPAYILEGYAGTGKTFLMKTLSLALPKVALTATTNKAAKELRRQTNAEKATTIYSLLGLRMEAKEDSLELKESRGLKNDILKHRFVILDEAGLVSKKLIPYLTKAMSMGVRFLFVGDRKQVPPVGESISQIWDAYPTVKLKKVLRHDNEILELATQVRRKKLPQIKWQSKNSNSEGVWCLSTESFTRKLKKYASMGFFKNGKAKAIAWRNKTNDELNRIIRFEMFGDKIFESKYLKDDQVVFTSPYNITQYVQAYIDDDGRILNVAVGEHPTYKFKCYFLTIQLDIGKHIIRALHEDSESEFEQLLVAAAENARQSNKKEDWFEFWNIKNSVAQLKYSHAITVHRAQGSTYDFVFAKVSDILQNSDEDEAKMCLYSALTRPSKRLFIN